jgi:exo-beta-1,3-glucanase (GH17 family)
MNLKRFTKINAMKIEYKIPESLKEITLGQYQDFLKLKESLEKETIEDFQFMMQSIKIFASGDLTKLEKLPQSKVSEIFEVVMGIFQKETNQAA